MHFTKTITKVSTAVVAALLLGTSARASTNFFDFNSDPWFSGGADDIGITIKVDNTTVTNIPMGIAHGGCTNLQSIQTGDTNALVPDDLCWTKLRAELTTNGLLNVNYKG